MVCPLLEAPPRPTSPLVFEIAIPQNFHEGNKRKALIAGLAFLKMNEYVMDIIDPELVSVVDK